MTEWFWGHKSTALFDVWSVEHFLAGLSIGALVMKATGRMAIRYDVRENLALRKHFDVLLVLWISFLWETVEHYLELGLAGPAVTSWFAGVEHWGNRIVTDPLMVLVGYVVVRSQPGLVWPARLLSATWLAVHLFVFPHSMYLHEMEWRSSVGTVLLAAMVVGGAAFAARADSGAYLSAATVRAFRATRFSAPAWLPPGRAVAGKREVAERA